MQYYPQIFTVHLVAVAVFGSGVLLTSFMLPSLRRGASATELDRLLRWTLGVTTPALVLVWACGITLAILAGWFDARWLQVKLVFVLGLTALHVHQVRCMLRMRRGARPGGLSYGLALAVAVALAAIAFLAGAKPL